MRSQTTLFAAGIAAITMTTISAAEMPNTGMADPAALISAFDHYQAALPGGFRPAPRDVARDPEGNHDQRLQCGRQRPNRSRTDLVTSTVKGLPLDSSFDLWLVQNKSGQGSSTMAEPTDVLVKVGTYQAKSKSQVISVTLPSDAPKGFLPDRAFVVAANQSPVIAFVLTGSATLFDRLLHHQVRLPGRGLCRWLRPWRFIRKNVELREAGRPGPSRLRQRKIQWQRARLRNLPRRKQ